ncbi:MAG: 2-dehydropantoate 2-reductase [Planctomycetota bacterium]|nr:2-dehydropantoate 2-reductase [Planctomycetota bacterium]
MRVVVVGAGAVGGAFAGMLARAGRDVVLLGRGKALEAIRLDGLLLLGAKGGYSIPIRATDRAEEIGPADLILICTKTYELEAALESARPCLGEGTVILPLQNGIESEETAGSILGADRVMGCVAYVGAVAESPGKIRHDLGGRLVIGEVSGGESERGRKLQSFFEESGILCRLSSAVRQDLWEKLVGNSVINVIPAITGCRVGDLIRDPRSEETTRAALEEAGAVSGSQGSPIDEEKIAGHLDFCRRYPEFETSTQQDVRRGRPTEVEAFNGAIMRTGRSAGIPTPIHTTLYRLLKAREAIESGRKTER